MVLGDLDSDDFARASGTVFFHQHDGSVESLPLSEFPRVVKETTVRSFRAEVGRRRVEQLAFAAMTATHKRLVKSVSVDVGDGLETPMDSIFIRQRTRLLACVVTQVNRAYRHLS